MFGVIKMKGKKLLLIGIFIFTSFIIINFYKIKFFLSLINLSRYGHKIESQSEDTKKQEAKLTNPLQAILKSVETVEGNENIEAIDDASNTADDLRNIDGIVSISIKEHNYKKSYNEIIQEYNDILEDLKLEFEAELDALIKQGIEEYSLGEISSTKLANKYLSLGADLEKSCDKKFYNLLNIMKNELKANGYDTLITDEIKNYYVSFKKARKLDLINRGMKYLK